MSYSTADTVHSGRYTAAQIGAILDRLDAIESQAVDRKRRQALRVVYRLPNLVMRITQPGGSVSDRIVQSRNLSATGLSFLYHGFLYPGTDVKVWLRRYTGGEEMTAGKITWCRHLTGPLHSCGVKFSTRVLHKLYIDPSLAAFREGAGTSPDQLIQSAPASKNV